MLRTVFICCLAPISSIKRLQRNGSPIIVQCLLFFGSCQCQLEVLGVGEDLVLVGILLLLFRALDDQCQYQHIDGQRGDGDYTLGYGIDQGRPDSGIHETVSIQHGDGGEDAAVLEQGNTWANIHHRAKVLARF